MSKQKKYDVFISYNSRNKKNALKIKSLLEEKKIKVWIDTVELNPGDNTIQNLNEAIKNTKTVLILIGNQGFGLWQKEEINSILVESIKHDKKIIPVLLPGLKQMPEISIFLENRIFSNMKNGITNENIMKLIKSIKSNKTSRNNNEISEFRINDNYYSPIISFCTDIEGSVEGIEKAGENIFHKYCFYLNKVAEFYTTESLKSYSYYKDKRILYSSLWIPGDSLWGIANKGSNENMEKAIIKSFARIITAIAYGLATVNNKYKSNNSNLFNIRAASFYGQIYMDEIFQGTSILYNGRCLNACGRIQNLAKKNSMILGFIFNNTNDLSKKLIKFINIEVPEIDFIKLEKNILLMINNKLSLEKGCDIIFNTVATENRQLLHLKSFPSRKIKGLKDTNIITTEISYNINKLSDTIKIINSIKGNSYRKTYSFNNLSEIDLYDMINMDVKLHYLKEIYKKNDIIFNFDKKINNFTLRYNGTTNRPKIVNFLTNQIENKKFIDFSINRYSILRIDRFIHSKMNKKILLIFTNIEKSTKSIIFTEIKKTIIKDLLNYNSYYNNSGLCIEYKIKNLK